MRQLAFYATLLFLLAACTDGQRMRHELAELQARNQADSLLTDDSLALALTDYFDRHGTANEQMLAHYLLGRTYSDMDELPQALSAYQEAVDRADTASSICDYKLLCRVHVQLGELFYWQQQYQRQSAELSKSRQYALLAGDTVMAAYCLAMRGSVLADLNEADSAITFLHQAIALYQSIGHDDYAAMCCATMVKPLLHLGFTDQARQCIDTYETKTGLFDSDGNIAEGSEIFYYIKARYCLQVQKYDSAEVYLRRLQRVATTLNDRIAVASGLSMFFESQNQADSHAKYARQASMLQDSLVAQIESDNILRLDKMYQYERLQAKINKKTQEAVQARLVVLILVCLLTILCLSSTYVYMAVRRKRRIEWKRYIEDQEELELLQDAVKTLEAEKITFSDRLSSVIDDAQDEIAQLEVRISNYEKKTATKTRGALVQQIHDTSVYQRLRKIADQPTIIPSLEDWQELRQVFDRIVPNFYATLYSGDYSPNETEYHLCMLVWLQFSPSDISNLIAFSNAYVSVARKKLLKNIFQIDGSTKEFDTKIREII